MPRAAVLLVLCLLSHDGVFVPAADLSPHPSSRISGSGQEGRLRRAGPDTATNLHRTRSEDVETLDLLTTSAIESRSLIGPGVAREMTTMRKAAGSLENYEPPVRTDIKGAADGMKRQREGVTAAAAAGTHEGADIIVLIRRLEERMSSLQSLSEQHLRRVENIEYRMTRLEVQGQERSEAERVANSEQARSRQQLAWQGGQFTAALENLRQGQIEQRQAIALLQQSLQSGSQQHGLSQGAEVLSRLQLLGNTCTTSRSVLASLQDHTASLARNFSVLANVTRQLRSTSSQLLSKQAFSSALLELRDAATFNAFSHLEQARVVASTHTSSREERLPEDCAAVQRSNAQLRSGVYRLQPALSSRPFFAFCELEARGGGWTVIHNRFEGSVDFYRDWFDYKHGFGNLGGEFWLGLDKLHQLTNTNEVNELVVELQDFSLETTHAQYSAFAVGSETEGYPMSFLTGYEGDAGDSLIYHAGMKFSTRDVDNDQWVDGNCAEMHVGAWWYNGCDTSNLNGRYLNGGVPESHEYQGMYWYDWHGPGYSLMRARLMIRPRNLSSTPLHPSTVLPQQGSQLPEASDTVVGSKETRKANKEAAGTNINHKRHQQQIRRGGNSGLNKAHTSVEPSPPTTFRTIT